MKILPSESLKENLKRKHLLLDTSVFSDYEKYTKDFAEFFNELKNEGVTFVTSEACKIEYIKGVKDPIIQKERSLLITDNLVDIIFPTAIYEKDISKTLIHYGKTLDKPNKVSYPDYLLATILMKFPNKIFLMTKNTNNDFPFNLEGHVVLYKAHAVECYGIYVYDQK